MGRSMKGAAAALAVAAALGSPAALAEGFDGKSNLVCATRDIMACADAYGCMQGQAREFEMPDFLYVDFKGKLVHARTADATKKVESEFRNLDIEDTHLIVQGVENGQGWTIAVDRTTGAMTTAVAGGKVNVMFFGVCTPISGR